MTFYLLTLILGNSAMVMSTVPDFPDKTTCEKAGENWTAAVSKREYAPRFYCTPYTGRGE